jgi:hypothetical protein
MIQFDTQFDYVGDNAQKDRRTAREETNIAARRCPQEWW